MEKQVDSSHYIFDKYMSKRRWYSVWHQLDEVINLKPATVLEIGPGPGVFKSMAACFGVNVTTLDIAEDLQPDIVGSATSIPASEKSYSVVCCFQMLEHLPFDVSMKALSEIARVAANHIVISLPNAETRWPYVFHLPKIGLKRFSIKKPFLKPREHIFDGEHYWEINKKGFDLDFLMKEINKATPDFELKKEYRVPENPYHHFFIFERSS